MAAFGNVRGDHANQFRAILARISYLDKLPLGLVKADLMLRHIHPLIEQTYQRLVDRRNYARRIGDPFPRSVIPLVPVPIVFGIG
jgi:hypothetical protein